MTPTNAWAVYLANGELYEITIHEATAHRLAAVVPPMEVRPVLVVPAGEVITCGVGRNDDGSMVFDIFGMPALFNPGKAKVRPSIPATLVIHRDGAEREILSRESNVEVHQSVAEPISKSMPVEVRPGGGSLTDIQRLERQVRAMKDILELMNQYACGTNASKVRQKLNAFPEDV